MTAREEADLLERFHRRLAGIEADVPEPPASMRPSKGSALGRPAASPRSGLGAIALSIVVVVVLIGVIAVQLPLIASHPPIGSGTPPTTPGSPNAVLAGPARLVVSYTREERALPSGVVTSGVDLSTYVARVSNLNGSDVRSWKVFLKAGDRGATAEPTFAAGEYRVTVARIFIAVQVETGVLSSSPPLGECGAVVTLGAGTTTHVAAAFPLDGRSCTIGTPTSWPTSTLEFCATVAVEYSGRVAGTFDTTVAGLRRLEPLEASPDKWPALAPDYPAVLCYIDGQVALAPPPDASGNVAEPFNRAVVAVVDGTSELVLAGYRDQLPVRAP
jgi:hypothetical protein